MKIALGTNRIIPFDLDVESATSPGRIGGRAPVTLTPRIPTSRYLVTVPFDDITFISLFQTKETLYYYDNLLYISREGDAFEVFFHEFLPRRSDRQFAGDLSEHALTFEPEQDDEDRQEDDVDVPSSRNKLGGQPYLLSNSRDRIQLVHAIKEEGFQQFLQLDVSMLSSPRARFTAGSFPYGDGLLHLFLKPPEYREWCCFWQS